MVRLFQPICSELHSAKWRGLSLIVLFLVVIGSLQAQNVFQKQRSDRLDRQLAVELEHNSQIQLVSAIKKLQEKIDSAKVIGADTTDPEKIIGEIKTKISDPTLTIENFNAIRDQIAVVETLIATQTEINRLAEEKRQSGILIGVVKEGEQLLGGVSLSLTDGTTTATTTSGSDGAYSFTIKGATYSLTASKSGYSSVKKTGVIISAQQTVTLNLNLSKAQAKSTTTTTTNSSATNGDSKYEKTSISTSRGSFSIHLSTFNLASGQFAVSTDTANDNDCADNCPTKSLSSYVGSNGGFAGMNGTYFCPVDYSACAGQVGSFFWKVINTRLGKMINANNGLGENDPFIAFNSAGTAKYFSSWSSYGGSGFSAVAGINCKPALISGGSNILNESSLDDKQRSTKSNRGAIGLKGQTLYLVIATSATVPDLAAVMDALDVDYALNVDGGGSSAMMFNSSYKIGPGRSLPNAIIIKRR